MQKSAVAVVLVFAMGACQAPEETIEPSEGAGPEVRAIAATGETDGAASGEANDPALLIDRANPAASLILGSGDAGGLEIFDLDGERQGVGTARPTTLVDVQYNFPLGGGYVDLIVGYDSGAAALVAYVLDDSRASFREVSPPMATEAEIEGMCLYQSPISGKFYAFAAGDGSFQQWELYPENGTVQGRLIRTVPVGPGAAHCVAHDRRAEVFYSQETVGVAGFNAEPESETEVEFVDLTTPHGRFGGDVKGVALYEQADGGYLIVSDADESRLQFYDIESHAHRGTINVIGGDAADSVEETEGLAATSLPLSATLEHGLLVLADDDNGDAAANYKLVPWQRVSEALGLRPGASHDPTAPLPFDAVTVSPSVETEPVASFGDAADDPALWLHPEDPALSVVIGTQKQRGINVYDLDGNLLQSREDGRINNADLRYGFPLGGEAVDIVTASNRSTDSIGIWKVDRASRTLVDVADGVIPTGMADPYGQCMYRSPQTGDYYVVINDTGGLVRQWRLIDAGAGRIGVELVREFSVGSQTEGCVADDETGDLYIGEEGTGIWKYAAEPDAGSERLLIDSVEDGNLTADVEGLAIYYGDNGEGYLIASNQGADNYTVYERQGDNRFLGHFHIVADEATGIDGVSETDGLDVTSANLGGALPNGVLVVQDGRNITPKGAAKLQTCSVGTARRSNGFVNPHRLRSTSDIRPVPIEIQSGWPIEIAGDRTTSGSAVRPLFLQRLAAHPDPLFLPVRDFDRVGNFLYSATRIEVRKNCLASFDATQKIADFDDLQVVDAQAVARGGAKSRIVGVLRSPREPAGNLFAPTGHPHDRGAARSCAPGRRRCCPGFRKLRIRARTSCRWRRG